MTENSNREWTPITRSFFVCIRVYSWFSFDRDPRLPDGVNFLLTLWAQVLASTFAKLGVSPNQVSLFSVVCALVGAGLFLIEAFGSGSPWLLVGAAVCIQMRLLANMLDGLIA